MAGQCLLSLIWNAVNTRKVQEDPKLDLWLSIIFVLHLYSYIKFTHHPYYNIITLTKKMLKTAWILDG